MAKIAGTNVSYGNPELHERIADEDLAMSMSLTPAPQGFGRVADSNNQLLSRLATQRPARVGRTFGEVASTPQAPPPSVSNFLSSMYTMPQELGMPTIAKTARDAYTNTIKDGVIAQMEARNKAFRQQSDRQRALEEMQARLSNPNLGDQLGSSFLRGQFENLANPNAVAVYSGGKYRGVQTPTGLFGGMVYSGDPNFDPARVAYEKKFGKQEDDRPEVVLPEYKEELGTNVCPDGYVFDEALQACRLDVSVPNLPASVQTAQNGYYESPYQSTGLLNTEGYNYGVPLIYG